jgi:hypothetical protein
MAIMASAGGDARIADGRNTQGYVGAVRRRRGGLVLLLAALVSCGLMAASAQAYSARVSVSKGATTGALGSGFLGLALELNTVPKWVGKTSAPVNPVLIQFIHNLVPTGRPVIRIGGQSTDRSWWPVPGMKRPLGVTLTLGKGWINSVRRFAEALNAKLLLGVNLEANRSRIPQLEASKFLSGLGQKYIDAFQVGNEPNLYPVIPWYKRLGGRNVPWYFKTGSPVFSRRPTYGPAQFAQEFSRIASGLPGKVPIAGPETGPPSWLQVFSRLITAHSREKILTSHAYGLNNCVTDPGALNYPSVPHLINQHASRGDLGAAAPFVGVAHRRGAAYRVDEMGSISCNGRPGVSNTMASALWVMDALFFIAREHVDGVNLHTYQNSDNGLFDFKYTHGRWQGTVHPIYYGALMFAQAAPAGSRLLHLHLAGHDQLRAWATRAPDHKVRVLLINDSLGSRAVANVQAPSGYGSHAGTVERLLASSAYAKGGLSLGGRRFGTTLTGALRTPKLETDHVRSGTYTLSLPAASAALLTLSPR